MNEIATKALFRVWVLLASVWGQKSRPAITVRRWIALLWQREMRGKET